MNSKKIQSQNMKEMSGSANEEDNLEKTYKKQKKSDTVEKKVPVKKDQSGQDGTEKKSFLDFKKLNKLYNDLMFKTASTDDSGKGKEKVINDIMKIVEPVMTKIVHKHDGCRILQGCVKFGSTAQRKKIIAPFIHADNFLDLLKSKYGHFLAMKFWKFLDKRQQDQTLSHIYKNFETLITQFESAKVVDRYVSKFGKKQKTDNIMTETFKTDSKSAVSHERLENAAVKISERQIFKFSLPQLILAGALKILIETERNKILESIKPLSGQICNKKGGAVLVCQCLNYWDAKDKRLVLKQLKTPILEHLLEEESFAFLVVIKSFKCIDDTVMLNKTLLSVLKKNLEQIMAHIHNHEIFLSLYDTKTDYLAKYDDIKDENTTSKKDDDLRRSELIEYMQDDLIKFLSVNLNEKLAHPSLSKLIYLVMKDLIARNDSERFSFIESVITVILEDYKTKSKQGKESESLLIHPVTHRLVKSFVIDYSTSPEDTKSFYEKNLQLILEILVQEAAVLINTKAIFIMIAFIEFTGFKDEVLQTIREIKHTIREKEMKSGYEIVKKYL